MGHAGNARAESGRAPVLGGALQFLALAMAGAIFGSGCRPTSRVLGPVELYEDVARPSLLFAEGAPEYPARRLFLDMLRVSKRMLVIEFDAPERQVVCAWGFSGGEYLASSSDRECIRLKRLNEDQRKGFEGLLLELPRAELGRREGSIAWDCEVVFIWGRSGDTLTQGFKHNPEGEEELGDGGFRQPELSEDRWILKATKLVGSLGAFRSRSSDGSNRDSP